MRIIDITPENVDNLIIEIGQLNLINRIQRLEKYLPGFYNIDLVAIHTKKPEQFASIKKLFLAFPLETATIRESIDYAKQRCTVNLNLKL